MPLVDNQRLCLFMDNHLSVPLDDFNISRGRRFLFHSGDPICFLDLDVQRDFMTFIGRTADFSTCPHSERVQS